MSRLCLSKTIVESEDAHYKTFQAPRLTIIPGGISTPVYEKVKEEVQQALQEFLQLQNNLQKSNAIFEEAWAFTYFKAIYEEFAEYVLRCRQEKRKMTREQIQDILQVFRDTPNKALYFKGAKLLMFIESNDALRDAELHYLQKYNPDKNKNAGPSYHRIVKNRILSEMRVCLDRNTGGKKAQGILKPLACACVLLLALI